MIAKTCKNLILNTTLMFIFFLAFTTNAYAQSSFNEVYMACKQHNWVIVDKIPKSTLDVLTNESGRSLLLEAFFENDLDLAQNLINRKIAIFAKDSSGKSALHMATFAKQSLMIELLNYFGICVDEVDNDNMRAVDYLREYPDEQNLQIIDLLTKLSNQEKTLDEEHPLYIYNYLENLVLQGGGAKGIAYVGAIKALEKLDALQNLKRVCGTSAGAITAAFLSLGYNSEEMHNILIKTNFSDFLDYPITEEKIVNLYEKTSFSDILKGALDEVCQIFKDPLSLITNTLNFFKNLWDTTGLCEGEDFRLWIEQKIYKKTKIKYCTFKELRNLSKINSAIKHLHIFTTRVEPSMQIVELSSENEIYDDVIISDAIRASMSIPGVFKPHTLYIKDNENNRIKKDTFGLFVDGGVLYNYPIDAFDTLKYQTSSVTNKDKDYVKLNKKTLGLSLYTPTTKAQKLNSCESISEFVSTLALLYYNSEALIHNLETYDKYRTIVINDEDISTLEFQLSDEMKKALEASGEEATNKFFKEQQKRLKEMNLIIPALQTL